MKHSPKFSGSLRWDPSLGKGHVRLVAGGWPRWFVVASAGLYSLTCYRDTAAN